MQNPSDRNSRILIADDEPQVRGLLHEFLSDSYECVDVSSAEEALALLEKEEFSLVVSDILMPGMTGLEMVPLVLQRAPDTVVIMISGEQTIESAIQAMRAGAFDYITKPFDLRHVDAAVRRALDHHSLLVAKRFYESNLEELVEKRTAERDFLSFHDPLTRLPNRTLFEDRLNQLLITAAKHEESVGVVLFSASRLGMINRTLGHKAGDDLIREVAARLTHSVDAGDTVARLGSDEFALLLRGITEVEDAMAVVKRIHESLEEPIVCDGSTIHVNPVMGVAISPGDGREANELLRNAGTALARGRESGKSYQFYTEGLHARALKRLEVENGLRAALENDEIIVHYQPQVDLVNGTLVGTEALVRWDHPINGPISPADFIPIAEETGIIVRLGEMALRRACLQTRQWHDSGFKSLRVSVNLSPVQFQQRGLTADVRRILKETGLNPRFLELEVTESSLLRNREEAIKTLKELRETGILIALDDFGTGYSSLSYLSHLPLDTLKIDQTFIRNATTDESSAAIIRTIITLAHSLGLNVKAEGVETEAQVALLRQLGCDVAQGYLFGTAMSPAGIFQGVGSYLTAGKP